VTARSAADKSRAARASVMRFCNHKPVLVAVSSLAGLRFIAI